MYSNIHGKTERFNFIQTLNSPILLFYIVLFKSVIVCAIFNKNIELNFCKYIKNIHIDNDSKLNILWSILPEVELYFSKLQSVLHLLKY